MPLRVRCPNDHALTLKDELAGKRIKCPKCATQFVVPGGKAAAPAASAKRPAAKRRPRDEDEEDEDDRPRRRSRNDDDNDDDDGDEPLSAEERRKERMRDKRRRLNHVRVGLVLHSVKLWSVALLILAGLLGYHFWLIVDAVNASPEKDLGKDSLELFLMLSEIFTYCGLAGAVLAPVLGIVGSGFCALAPKKTEGGGSILTALVSDALPLIGAMLLLLSALDVFGFDKPARDRFEFYLAIANGLFSIAAIFLFLVFLRQLCHYLQKPSLGNEALNSVTYLMIQVVSLPALVVGNYYLFRMFMGMMGSFMAIIVLFGIIIGWFAQFYYLFFMPVLRLLQSIRDLITGDSRREKE